MEEQYLKLLVDIMINGNEKGDRTGTGTRSVFGRQLRFDLSDRFPLLTTKKVFWKGVVHELLWMLSGSTNINVLKDAGVNIWNEWADEQGELGPVYGHQWRNFDGIGVDQISDVIQRIKDVPNDRRLIVTAWNPKEVADAALPPCHCFFQFYVADGKLSCQLYQRSADVFLGVPFNIASYALLTCMIAQVCGLEPGEFVHTFGDVHIYNNHVEQVALQTERKPMKPPKLILNKDTTNVFDFTPEDIRIADYGCHPAIKAKVAV